MKTFTPYNLLLISLFCSLLRADSFEKIRMTDIANIRKEMAQDWHPKFKSGWNSALEKLFKTGKLVEMECNALISQYEARPKKYTFPRDRQQGIYRMNISCDPFNANKFEEKHVGKSPEDILFDAEEPQSSISDSSLAFVFFGQKSATNRGKYPALKESLENLISKNLKKKAESTVSDIAYGYFSIKYKIVKITHCGTEICEFAYGNMPFCGDKANNTFSCFDRHAKPNGYQGVIELLDVQPVSK